MSPALYLRLMGREGRGSRGRLVFFTLCLSVGVSAVVAVAGLAASLDAGLRAQARPLLAADLVVEGHRPPPPEFDRALAEIPGVKRTRVRETISVVSAVAKPIAEAPGAGPAAMGTAPATPRAGPPASGTAPATPRAGPPASGTAPAAPGASLLVELKAVEGEFPFYGTLRLDPDRPLAGLLDDRSAVVAPELLARLKIDVGDTIRIGSEEYRIAGKVLSEPDRLNVSFSIAPRVFVSGAGLERARLGGFGSRFDDRTLLKLPEASTDVDAVAARLKKTLPESGHYEVRTWVEAQPEIREGLRRGWRFLGLGALLSLLIGGIGVAQTVSAWLSGRMDSIAVLKCLGVRPREILFLYLGQTALLGLAGSLAGVLLGVAAQMIAPRLLGGFVEVYGSGSIQPLAIVRGLALGIGVAIVFSLPPLVSILRVPPVLVMRRSAEPLRVSRWAGAASAVAVTLGVLLTAWTQSRSALWSAAFAGGLAVSFGLLALAALAVIRLVRTVPRTFARVTLRHGLAALARPGSGTVGAIAAVGLGVLVVVTMYLVEDQLSSRLEADLPAEAPTAFMVDIQPDQWPALRALLEAQGARRIDSVPMVVARLSKVDGRGVEAIAAERPDAPGRKWALTREQRLTYLDRLPDNNTIVEGSLWCDPKRPEISLERDFARDLGAHLGSVLTFDLQGVPIELTVTSLRTVKWESLGINFFLVVEPGVLDKAPQVRVAAARLPVGREQEIQDLLARSFPNIVLIDIRAIIEKVVAILDRVGLGIRILGGFTVVAGIAILAGAIGAGSVRRGREVALLKTLGMTRPGVALAFSTEYALIGLVAGSIGSGAGFVLAHEVLTRAMKVPWRFDLPALAVAIAGSALLAVLAGLAASLRALSKRPVEVLRGEL